MVCEPGARECGTWGHPVGSMREPSLLAGRESSRGSRGREQQRRRAYCASGWLTGTCYHAASLLRISPDLEQLADELSGCRGIPGAGTHDSPDELPVTISEVHSRRTPDTIPFARHLATLIEQYWGDIARSCTVRLTNAESSRRSISRTSSPAALKSR